MYKAVSGYICNMGIYTAKGKKVEDTMLLPLNRNIDNNRQSYRDRFCNSVRLVATLLDRSVSVCGNLRANKCEHRKERWKNNTGIKRTVLCPVQ